MRLAFTDQHVLLLPLVTHCLLPTNFGEISVPPFSNCVVNFRLTDIPFPIEVFVDYCELEN